MIRPATAAQHARPCRLAIDQRATRRAGPAPRRVPQRRAPHVRQRRRAHGRQERHGRAAQAGGGRGVREGRAQQGIDALGSGAQGCSRAAAAG